MQHNFHIYCRELKEILLFYSLGFANNFLLPSQDEQLLKNMYSFYGILYQLV